MEIDSEDKADRGKVLDLEDASITIEEAKTPVVNANVNEVSCQKLINLPSTKVALARTGVKSMHMEQMFLLGKMDARRLMKKRSTRTIVVPMNVSIVEF